MIEPSTIEVRRVSALLPTGERRRHGDRRLADRRRARSTVPIERRRGKDRRLPMGRRESAAGHVRQAIQLLDTLAPGAASSPHSPEVVAAALRRLWLGLRELGLGNLGR
jgi:hypothetical protein